MLDEAVAAAASTRRRRSASVSMPYGADEPAADRVHHVVDVAPSTTVSASMAPSSSCCAGVWHGRGAPPGRRTPPACARGRWGRSRRASLRAHPGRLRRPTRSGEQPLEASADVRPGEHRVVGHLVQADPQPQVVVRRGSTPRRTRRGWRHDEQLVGWRAAGSAGRTGRTCAGRGARPSSPPSCRAPSARPSARGRRAACRRRRPRRWSSREPASSSPEHRRRPQLERHGQALEERLGRHRALRMAQSLRFTGATVRPPPVDRRGQPGDARRRGGRRRGRAARAACARAGRRWPPLSPSVATDDARAAGPRPSHRPLLAEHAGQVAEERHALERVRPEWTGVAHEGIVGR